MQRPLRPAFIITFACLLVVQGASAQEIHQPYAGLMDREIKTLSDEEISDLSQGRGMGLALAAELNGYPGPLHVLELADELDLTERQRARIEGHYEAMQREAMELGEQVIELEAELDRQFEERTVTPESLTEVTTAIGKARAALRATHLRYHLTAKDVLTDAQIADYAALRGYEDAHRSGDHHHGSPGH